MDTGPPTLINERRVDAPFLEDVMDTELEKRVAALEQALGGKAPPEVCRFCGERAVRLHRVQSDEKGLVEENWKCVACSQIDVQVFRPPVR